MSSCVIQGNAPSFGGWCLSWAQTQLGLAHIGSTAADAYSIYAAQGAAVASPSPGDLVFFSPGPANQNAGHVGIVQGDVRTFRSVLSNGDVAYCDIQGFASDNGVGVLGYISAAAIGGASGVSLPIVGAVRLSGKTVLVGVAVIVGGLFLLDNL